MSQPRNVRITLRLGVVPFLALVLAAATGCKNGSPSSDTDMAFLDAPLTTISPRDSQTNLLPLDTGNRWEMRTVTRGKKFADTLRVLGPARVGTMTAMELEANRDGKKWRREFYISDKNTVSLAAMQDETSPLMTLSSPMTLVKAPFIDGQTWQWEGTLKLKNFTFPATGFSRVSALESAPTSAGQFKAYRIDSIVIMVSQGREIRFPSVRWFAPGVGFIRRGFADKGEPAFSELVEFTVR